MKKPREPVDCGASVDKDSDRLAGGRQGVGNLVEGRVGPRADRGDGGQADDHDESEHDGILNSGRAIFGNEQVTNAE